MRTRLVAAILLLGISLVPVPILAQAAKPAAPPTKSPPSRVKQVVRQLADTAATSAAGLVIDTLLGQKGRAVAQALTGNTGVAGLSCPAGTAAVPMQPSAGVPGVAGLERSAGSAVVGAAKQALKTKAPPAGAATGFVCQPIVVTNSVAGAARVAGVGMGAMPGGVGVLAAATPVGMAVAAAPLAGQAVKGLKGMFGGKPMDKIGMLRELGKGRLELKAVKFIEGTAELEPGFEPTLAALGEALPLSEGTFILHVAAEQGEKGEPPDTVLARKRIERAWAALLVNGVPDQRVIAVGVLPTEMQQGRKPPKRGEARIEFIRLPKQP